MCCLSFEQAIYQEAKPRVPRVGETVTCPRGLGRVVSRNILKECITVQFEDGTSVVLCPDEVERAGKAPPTEGESEED